MPLELAVSRPRSSFPESRNALSKTRSAKLNTDVTILMPGKDYFGETALKQDITYLSTKCGNHKITHFRCTGSSLHSNLDSQQNYTFFAVRETTGFCMELISTFQHKRRRYVTFQPNNYYMYRRISYVSFLFNNYHCTISKSKPLNGTETSLRRALISNNSVSLVLKKELWISTEDIGAGRGGCGGGGGG